jgi:hypothetical protein
MNRRRKTQVRPQRAALDSQTLRRELQKALAVAKCMRLAAEYDEDDALDIADALAGLLIVLEGTAVLLDQSEAQP